MCILYVVVECSFEEKRNQLQLSEAVALQSPNTSTMAPVGEDDPLGIPDTALAMQEGGTEVATLHQRLTALEEDNAMLRASCAALQSQLDQVSLCPLSTGHGRTGIFWLGIIVAMYGSYISYSTKKLIDGLIIGLRIYGG